VLKEFGAKTALKLKKILEDRMKKFKKNRNNNNNSGEEDEYNFMNLSKYSSEWNVDEYNNKVWNENFNPAKVYKKFITIIKILCFFMLLFEFRPRTHCKPNVMIYFKCFWFFTGILFFILHILKSFLICFNNFIILTRFL
jgi:hypothetical protein